MTTGKKKRMTGGWTLTDKTFKAVFQSLGQYYRLKEEERPDNNAMIEYYNAVKFVDDTDARKLYSEVVNSLKFFPKIPEIKEIAERHRPKTGRFSNTDFCYCCLNVGHITYIREENGHPYEYLARCPYCNMGKNYPELPPADRRFTQEELEELIRKNKGKYSEPDRAQVRQMKDAVRVFLKSL